MSAQVEQAVDSLRVANEELIAARTNRENIESDLQGARSREDLAVGTYESARSNLIDVAVAPE